MERAPHAAAAEELTWYAELAWLGGDREHVDRDVVIVTEGERVASVETGVPVPPRAAVRLPGLVLPALANAHSHAFHRVLRGRTQAAGGDFWSWRQRMYQLAAPADAGVRITLLDTCYLQGDVDARPLEGVQQRFGDGSADAWADRVEALRGGITGHPAARLGAAIHSVRAVPPPAMAAVAAWAAERGAPLHLHLSEQRRENQACLAVTGRTPTQLCADAGVLGARTTAVHATHLAGQDFALLGGGGTAVCLCPTTERDLADGIGPARRLAAAGCPLALGSDSHAVVDLLEEARAVELDERLASGRRGQHRPVDLLAAATRGGMRSLGWDAGAVEPGRLADLVALRLDSPRLAGAGRYDLLAAVVFAAAAADVTDLVVGGRQVVAAGRHLLVADVPTALARSIQAVVNDGSA